MAYYESISLYINSTDDSVEKIKRYDAIILKLQDAALNGAENQDIGEYQLDDGQTKIRNIFRDPNQIFKAIQNYEKLKQMEMNKLNGGVVRLVDFNSNNFC